MPGGLLLRCAARGCAAPTRRLLVPQHFPTQRGSGAFSDRIDGKRCVPVDPGDYSHTGADWHTQVVRRVSHENGLQVVEVCGGGRADLRGGRCPPRPSLSVTLQPYASNSNCRYHDLGNANPAAPAARNLRNYHGTGEIVPFVSRTFEWGVVIATFLSDLSVVPRHCARLTSFLHPKSRKINAALLTPQLITIPPAAPAARKKRSLCNCRLRFPDRLPDRRHPVCHGFAALPCGHPLLQAQAWQQSCSPVRVCICCRSCHTCTAMSQPCTQRPDSWP